MLTSIQHTHTHAYSQNGGCGEQHILTNLSVVHILPVCTLCSAKIQIYET